MNIVQLRATTLEDKIYNLYQDRLHAGLTEKERDFLDAAEIGDIETLKNLLEEGDVSVDCVDPQGRTALELAVVANVENVVVFLLDKASEVTVHKALLCACDMDRDAIFETIIGHRLYNGPVSDEGDQGEDEKIQRKLREALIIAAKRNNFQIVKQLMLRGATLSAPHDYFCNCSQCNAQRTGDFKMYTTNRLDTFRAMASPAYMVLTEEDPILTAFRHSVKFRKLAEIESEFQADYTGLDKQVQDFTTELMDQCHSSDEVKAILTGSVRQQGEDDDGSESEENSNDVLPLLSAAIKMEQKKFVAHSQCQAQISELWYSGVPFLRYLNKFTNLMLALPIGTVLVPIMSVIYLIWPWGKVSQILSTPLMRFLSYTCSYLSFISIVMVTKLKISYFLETVACDDYNPVAFAVVTVLLMWIIGLIWEECKQIGSQGAKDYFSSLWNVIDFLMLSFLLGSFVLEVITPLKMRQLLTDAMKNGNNATFTKLLSWCNTIRRTKGSLTGFCYNTEPAFQVVWEPSWVPDPELVSDVMFTFGTILTISRFAFIMPCNEALGTMLVSFRRCIVDLLKLCGMFILVIVSFASGLTALYSSAKCRNSHFESFESTVSSLTWSLFGMGDVSFPVLNHIGPLDSLTNSPHRVDGVQTIGLYLYATYVFAAMIILLNLLIAVMSNSFQEVQDERDTEWTFSRTELWLTFIEPGTLVQPPFNIIPSPKSLLMACRYFYHTCVCCRNTEDEPKIFKYACVNTNEFNLSKEDEKEVRIGTNGNGRHKKQAMYCTLIRRYVRNVEKKKDEENDEAGDDILRKLIERMANRIDRKMDDLYHRIKFVETNVDTVHDKEVDIKKLQVDYMEMMKMDIEKRQQMTELFMRHMDESKSELVEHLNTERKEVIRIWEGQLGDVMKKWEESKTGLEEHLRSLEDKQTSHKEKLADMETRQTSLEVKESSLEAKQTLAEEKLSSVEAKQASLEDKQTSVENKQASLETKHASVETDLTSLAAKQASLEAKLEEQKATEAKQALLEEIHETEAKQTSEDKEALEEEIQEKEDKEALEEKIQEKEDKEALEEEIQEKEDKQALEEEIQEKEDKVALEEEIQEKEDKQALEEEIQEKEDKEALEEEIQEQEDKQALEEEKQEGEDKEASEEEIQEKEDKQASEEEKQEGEGEEASKQEQHETESKEQTSTEKETTTRDDPSPRPAT